MRRVSSQRVSSRQRLPVRRLLDRHARAERRGRELLQVDRPVPVDVALGDPLRLGRLDVQAAQLLDLGVVVPLVDDLHRRLESRAPGSAVVSVKSLIGRLLSSARLRAASSRSTRTSPSMRDRAAGGASTRVGGAARGRAPRGTCRSSATKRAGIAAQALARGAQRLGAGARAAGGASICQTRLRVMSASSDQDVVRCAAKRSSRVARFVGDAIAQLRGSRRDRSARARSIASRPISRRSGGMTSAISATSAEVDPAAVEDHRAEHVERRVDQRPHRRAVALAHDDQAEAFEHLDGLADRGAVDAELLGQLALGRQLRRRRRSGRRGSRRAAARRRPRGGAGARAARKGTTAMAIGVIQWSNQLSTGLAVFRQAGGLYPRQIELPLDKRPPAARGARNRQVDQAAAQGAGIVIRKARVADCVALTRIAHAAKRHWGYPTALMRLWKADLTVTPSTLSGQEVYCAIRGATRVGFYALSGVGRTRELEHMWVRPTYMGSGVGRTLFAHLLRHARATGATRLVIAADPNAEGFYRRMGAKPAGRVPSRPAGRSLPRLILRLARVRTR